MVALGSMIGSVSRAIASLGIHAHIEPGLPWGTLFVNVTGSFAIGLYATLTGPEGRLLAGSRQRQFVMTGICGGYTTFSVFSLETFRLLQAGDRPGFGRAQCRRLGRRLAGGRLARP
jgi:CrcB protein